MLQTRRLLSPPIPVGQGPDSSSWRSSSSELSRIGRRGACIMRSSGVIHHSKCRGSRLYGWMPANVGQCPAASRVEKEPGVSGRPGCGCIFFQ